MKILNDSFYKALENINEPITLFLRILKFKLSEINIKLYKKQIKRIKKQFESGHIKVNITDSQIKKSGYTEKYVEEYIKKIFESFDILIQEYEEKYIKIITEMTTDISDIFSEKIYSQLTKTYKRIKKNREKIHKNLQNDAYNHWKESFDFMDMILYITREIIESLEVKEDDINPNKNLLLVKFMSKGCLLFSEIICLLKNGFPDGAYSLWRSLHEITVLAEFISSNSDEISRKYIDHQYVQDYKHAKKIIEDSNHLYQYEITNDEFIKIKNKYDQVIEKYGRNFMNDYGWAYDLFDKKKVYFTDIEESVDFQNIRSHYRMSSDTIHTNARGLFYNMGLIDNYVTDLLIGPSIVGLSIPISLAVTSICLLNMNVIINLNNEVLMDDLVFMKIFSKFKENIIPNCFSEEDTLYQKLL